MELGMVPTLSIVGMFFSLILILALVIVLIIVGVKKYKASISTFFIGAATFIVFALILERILHGFVGKTFPTIVNNIWSYALYGALAAAVFEETGRIVAFKICLKNKMNQENAFMYGVGHGGIEAILLGALTCFSNLATSIMINNGTLAATLQLLDSATAEVTYNQVSQLWTLSSDLFFAVGIERLSAVILHISLSFLVYTGLKNKKAVSVILAYAIHFIVDFVAVVLNNYIPVWALEALVGILSIGAFFLATKLLKKSEA